MRLSLFGVRRGSFTITFQSAVWVVQGATLSLYILDIPIFTIFLEATPRWGTLYFSGGYKLNKLIHFTDFYFKSLD